VFLLLGSVPLNSSFLDDGFEPVDLLRQLEYIMNTLLMIGLVNFNQSILLGQLCSESTYPTRELALPLSVLQPFLLDQGCQVGRLLYDFREEWHLLLQLVHPCLHLLLP